MSDNKDAPVCPTCSRPEGGHRTSFAFTLDPSDENFRVLCIKKRKLAFQLKRLPNCADEAPAEWIQIGFAGDKQLTFSLASGMVCSFYIDKMLISITEAADGIAVQVYSS